MIDGNLKKSRQTERQTDRQNRWQYNLPVYIQVHSSPSAGRRLLLEPSEMLEKQEVKNIKIYFIKINGDFIETYQPRTTKIILMKRFIISWFFLIFFCKKSCRFRMFAVCPKFCRCKETNFKKNEYVFWLMN